MARADLYLQGPKASRTSGSPWTQRENESFDLRVETEELWKLVAESLPGASRAYGRMTPRMWVTLFPSCLPLVYVNLAKYFLEKGKYQYGSEIENLIKC